MLASFSYGREIIFNMLQRQSPCIPFRVSSYPVRRNREESGIENAFSVILEEGNCDLFQFLFNTVIINYYDEKFADLHSLFDTLSVRRLTSRPGSISYVDVN
jgi:hypothetical protein